MIVALKYYLPVFMLGYLLMTFVLPSVRVYRQSGINPVTFGKSDNAHDYIGFIIKVLTVLLIITVVLFSLNKKAYNYLNPFEYLEREWVAWCGIFLIHASLIWVMIAQSHMKQSWRIGIDEKNPTFLITTGLFSVSRNPVFLGMITSLAGMFLILPNALTFCIAVTSYIVIQVQVRLEEEHLQKLHGPIYSAYRKKVRRFI